VLGLARLLRLSSLAICLIVIVSFLVFAVDQTSSASSHQQEQLSSIPGSGTASASSAVSAPAGTSAPASTSSARASHAGGLHKALDEVSNQLTSPFAGMISSSSEWAVRGVKVLLTLLVYGFGLGYIARVIRIRA